MRILVVTPTYNERENLEPLCAAVLSSPVGADFLVVDDASPDGTGRIADAIAAREPRFRVLHRAGKLGLGTAYVEAFEQALEGGYDAVITMDGDWSHDPKYLPDLVDATSRAELVIGSRYLKGISVVNWDLKRLILSQFANNYARAITGLSFEGAQLGRIRSSGYSFLIELKYRVVHAGLRGEEVPIVFTDRRLGSSKISKTEVLRSMVTPWRLRFGRS